MNVRCGLLAEITGPFYLRTELSAQVWHRPSFALGVKVGKGPGATPREGRPGAWPCGAAKVGNEPLLTAKCSEILDEFAYFKAVRRQVQMLLDFERGFLHQIKTQK